MSDRRLVPLALVILTVVGLADTALNLQWPGRPFVALLFLLLVPGYAVVGHLRLDPLVAAVAVAIGLSIAIGTLAAQLMLWINVWSPGAAQLVLALPSILLLLMQGFDLRPGRTATNRHAES
ncbi:MAG: hypothetical protein ACXVKA_09695 [Acidimicrobiia bacterium]